MGSDEFRMISIRQLKNNFCLEFSSTMFSILGETVPEIIQIHKANFMLMNEIFTAITRSDNFQ